MLKYILFYFSFNFKYFLLYKNSVCWLLVGYVKKEGVFYKIKGQEKPTQLIIFCNLESDY
nr:MAG TPA: hypothetical protein [Caudoviricetes sp.]